MKDKKTILVLEDKEYHIRELEKIVSFNGFIPEIHENYVSCMRALQKGDYVAAILDVQVPRDGSDKYNLGNYGYEVANRIEMRGMKIPIAMHTSYSKDDVLEEVPENVGYIYKSESIDSSNEITRFLEGISKN